MIKNQPFIIVACFVLALAAIFRSNKLQSESAQPPPDFANNPPIPLNCTTSCHDSYSPLFDSTNFVLNMGTDSNNLSEMISGVTTYVPGTTYYLQVSGTHSAPRYGFELTAEDDAQKGSDIGTFTVLDASTTSLQNILYSFVGHLNAGRTHVWTFQWVAPTAYTGPITFYWCGNDANGDGTDKGDSIFIATKTITSGVSAINNLSGIVSAFKLFPTVTSGNMQLQFNLSTNELTQAEVIGINGELVTRVVNENMQAGNYDLPVDVNNLSAGIYLLKLQVGDGFVVKKFVKE